VLSSWSDLNKYLKMIFTYARNMIKANAQVRKIPIAKFDMACIMA
jgi:hypothetical protein